jgi:hypothetical protein
MSIKTFVIGAIVSAASASISQAQAPENFRIQYDECGVRSLAWDPVGDATEYRVDRGIPPLCWWDVTHWDYLGTIPLPTTEIVDAPDASWRYRVTAIAAGVELGAAEIEGDSRWCGPMAVTPSEGNTVVCGSQPLRFAISVRSRTAPLSFEWRRNGIPIVAPNAETLDLLITEQDESAVISVAVSNTCETATFAWSALSFGHMPAPGVLLWTALSYGGYESWNRRTCQLVYSCSSQWCSSEDRSGGSSWGASCNHGELQTDHVVFSLHSHYNQSSYQGCNGCWSNHQSYSGGSW